MSGCRGVTGRGVRRVAAGRIRRESEVAAQGVAVVNFAIDGGEDGSGNLIARLQSMSGGHRCIGVPIRIVVDDLQRNIVVAGWRGGRAGGRARGLEVRSETGVRQMLPHRGVFARTRPIAMFYASVSIAIDGGAMDATRRGTVVAR